jgi:hypothetical protein
MQTKSALLIATVLVATMLVATAELISSTTFAKNPKCNQHHRLTGDPHAANAHGNPHSKC